MSNLTCPTCGVAVEAERRPGRPRVYCSSACYPASQPTGRAPGRPVVPRVLVPCKFCGTGVEKTVKEASRIKTSICRPCRNERRNVEWRCRKCGAVETLTASQARRISRCRKCRPEKLLPMVVVSAECDTCDVRFTRTVASGTTPRFCSNSCRKAWFSAAFVGENSPQWLGGDTLAYGVHWKQMRRAVYARDGYRCRSCRQSDGRLIAAHLIPRRAFAEPLRGIAVSDAPWNLVALCMPCHATFDRNAATRWDDDKGTRAHWPSWAHA